MPHGPPPVNRRDRRPARVTQLERNARIAQLGRGGRPGHRQRPNAAAGFPMPSPRGATPASRRDRRPARNIQPGRNARIAQLDVGRRHRRGARPGHRRRSNTATGFPTPSPRGPSPASRRDRRPARNIQLERNARIAQLERGGRHRRGRRQGHGQRPNTAAGFPKPSPRGAPPASRHGRRPARNPHPGRNACIARLDVGRRHRRGHRPGHRQRPNAAAGFSQAVAARAAAREPSRPTPRAGHPARAQCAHCAARARRPQPSRPPTRSPPAPECRRWFFHAAAARAAAREPSRPSPRAEHPPRAQCAHCAARARRPPPSRPPAGSRPAPEHCHRFSKAVAARAVGRHRRDRRPARNAQPGRNARIARLDVGRRHRRGARPGHRQRSNTAPGRPAQSPRWAGPLLRARAGPSRNTQPGAPLALRTITDGGRHRRGPNPGTAPPPPQRSRSSLRPRTVAPSTESAHRGRFPT